MPQPPPASLVPHCLATTYHDLDEDEDKPDPPKPVIDVAYFGDSGGSLPATPENQADNTRAILVIDPSKKTGAAPDTSKGQDDIVSVAENSTAHDQDDPAESLPVNASDM
ncbi:hypothetical protein FRC10_010460 [Ceratobasidium sp. 414]|nr:hypothetical protein FRC10_010460 [Ceratobasidium sp. 414]